MPSGTSLKVTILGCGTSTGVPMAGCTCPVCTSPDPKNKRLRTSALISYQGKNILIDAGPDFRQQMLTARVEKLDAVIFTHAHADHILGVDELRVYNFKLGAPIPCYGSSETLAQIKRIFYYIFERDSRHMGGALTDVRLHTIENFQPIDLFGLSITPFPLTHGNVAVTGYKFGNFAFATDCKEIPAESRELLKGTEIMVLDGLREHEHNTHFTIDQAIQTGQELGIKQLYLIHMSHSVEYQSASAKLPAGVAYCYDGLKLEVRLG